MKELDENLLLDWIQKLKSGEYKQGKYYLRCGDEYCCLGVLCDLFDSSKWIDKNDECFLYKMDAVNNTTFFPICFRKLVPQYI